MGARRLSEEEKQTVVRQQSAQAVAQYPGSLDRVVVANQTDDNGQPKVKVLLAGQSVAEVVEISRTALKE